MLLQQWKSVSINKKLDEKVATKNFLITNSRRSSRQYQQQRQ